MCYDCWVSWRAYLRLVIMNLKEDQLCSFYISPGAGAEQMWAVLISVLMLPGQYVERGEGQSDWKSVTHWSPCMWRSHNSPCDCMWRKNLWGVIKVTWGHKGGRGSLPLCLSLSAIYACASEERPCEDCSREKAEKEESLQEKLNPVRPRSQLPASRTWERNFCC